MSRGESVRAFVAVPLSEEVRAAALEAQGRLREAWGDKVKWVEGDNLHITLKFLGQVEVEGVGRIGDVLERIAGGFGPFEVRTGGVGAFPSPGRVRVVWYGVREGGQSLAALGRAVEKSLEGLGFEAEERFHAHVTLGRVRRESDGRALAWPEGIGSEDGECLMRIERFVLMQSILSGSGPTYQIWREFPLGGEGAREEERNEQREGT